MKKSIMLVLAALLALPVSGIAQNRPKIKSVDLTLEVPAPGMSMYDAQEMQFTSAKTEFGDLAPTGGIQVYSLDWVGDFREADDGDMFFKDGFTYKAKLKFIVDSNRYDTDYVFKDNDYSIDGSRISATVNGVKATVLRSAPYVISVEFSCRVGTGGKGSERELAQSKPTDYDLNKNSFRASQKAYSIAEADAACPDISPLDVVTIGDAYHPALRASSGAREFRGQKGMLITKMIVDTDNERIYEKAAIDVHNYIQGPYNIREVWLSDKVDAVAFVRSMYTQMQANFDPETKIFAPGYSFLFYSRRATLFVPEESVGKVLEMFTGPRSTDYMTFTLKAYSGDVYSAQKKGADAARNVCVKHVFNDKVASADKIYRYNTCSNAREYYYSCSICGENERNPKHVFNRSGKAYDFFVHQHDRPLANAQAYVGMNSAGQHVWWYSCLWCGTSKGYHDRHISRPEWKASGNQASYEMYCEAMTKLTEDYEEQALLSTSALPDMFVLKRKSTAHMSPEYESSVNFALNDNLLDDSVLGDDYTLPLNYGQLCSLAGNLIKELVLKEAKASALRMDKVFGGSAPAEGSPVSRQEMAAVMYRSLRYIEEAGVYAYTEYTPSLDKYSDSGTIAPWAKEAMEFMEALGLMGPVSGGKLSPEKPCTIEEAIELAEKCTHAHQIGWYQARSWGEGEGRDYDGAVYEAPNVSTNHTYAPGERVWVTGPRIGTMLQYLPIIDSLTGTDEFVKAEWYRPIRRYVYTSKRTITGPVIFADYFDGAPAR